MLILEPNSIASSLVPSPCPQCKRQIPVESRRAMERFPCPGCMTMLTVVDTPSGRRLAGQVASGAKPAPATASPAKVPAKSQHTPKQATATARPTGPSPVAKPLIPSQPSLNPIASVPRSVAQRPPVPSPRATGGGNAGIIFGVAILVLFAVTVGVVASFRDGGLFGPSGTDSALEVADSNASTTDANNTVEDKAPTGTPSGNEVAANNSAGPMSPGNSSTPMVNPPNMATPEMSNGGGSVTTPAPKVMTPPSTPSTPAASNPAAPAPMSKLTTQQIVKLCEPSVARITTQFGSLGTGFVVGPQIVATNEHVVGLADPAGMTIRFPSRGPDVQFRRVELAYAVKDVDLVLLKVSDMPADEFRPLDVARISDLDKGEPLLIIGNPGGLTNVVTQGLFGSVQRLGGSDYLQLSMSINQGNSGGPALTAKGQVAGVVTLKSPQEGIGLAIPGDIVKSAVQKVSGTATPDIAQNVAWWRARQTGTKLLVGCKLSADLVRLYSDAAQRGNARAVNMAARRNGQLIQQVRLYRDDLNASLRYVAGSDLPEQHKQVVGQLDNAFQALSRVALQPPTSGNQLRNAIAAAQRVPQLEQQLKSTLGVMNTASEVALETN